MKKINELAGIIEMIEGCGLTFDKFNISFDSKEDEVVIYKQLRQDAIQDCKELIKQIDEVTDAYYTKNCPICDGYVHVDCYCEYKNAGKLEYLKYKYQITEEELCVDTNPEEVKNEHKVY